MAKRRQPATKTTSGADARLVALGQELHRTIRRVQRLRGQTSEIGGWSNTIDHGLKLVDQISTIRANGLEGLATKLWAVTWFLDETDAVLDLKGLRQLRALSREMGRLAK